MSRKIHGLDIKIFDDVDLLLYFKYNAKIRGVKEGKICFFAIKAKIEHSLDVL